MQDESPKLSPDVERKAMRGFLAGFVAAAVVGFVVSFLGAPGWAGWVTGIATLIAVIWGVRRWAHRAMGWDAAEPREREAWQIEQDKFVRKAAIVAIATSLVAIGIFALSDGRGALAFIGGISGIVAFYSWIQVFEPGSMVGRFRMIRCPHCGWANKINRVPGSQADPLWTCTSCSQRFPWMVKQADK